MSKIGEIVETGRTVIQIQKIQTFSAFTVNTGHDRVFFYIQVNVVCQISETDENTSVIFDIVVFQRILADSMDQPAFRVEKEQTADLWTKCGSEKGVDRNIILTVDAYRLQFIFRFLFQGIIIHELTVIGIHPSS